MRIKTIEFRYNAVYLLDQTRLPQDTVVLELRRAEEVVEAIRSLRIRGAPAIGVAAAYGLVLAAAQLEGTSLERFRAALREEALVLGEARPTAVNLRWALQRLLKATDTVSTVGEARRALLEGARSIQAEQED